jgi:isopentenyl diphosphate isomerase/L-lactate dehydrogenase-like FMN-dependent dehydrogenase
MNRRTFAQQLALGTGSLGMLPLATLQSTCAADELPQPGVPGDHAANEPVKVTDFQTLAAAKLPKATYDYITTGSADEITLRENVAAFQRIRILPPLLTGVAIADPATTVLKQQIRLPIMLAPVAGQQMYHPHGALAAARAAAAAGTVYGVSSSVGHSVEEVAGASQGPKWFQLYVPKDRGVARRLVERAERAGYQAIIVTVDLGEWKDADRRNRFALPKEVLVKHLRDVGFTQITSDMSYEEVVAFNAQAWDLALSWDVFAWLRSVTKLPLLIKGVLRKEDATKAVSLGLDGIIVSNHGGRRLDGMPASIEMLPEVVQAVGGRAEVFMDGGIRRGTDVLIALALGAQAVLIGRPYAWALGANGEAGVRKVLDLLREELLNAMVATGCAKISDIRPTLLRR